jgi:selenium-binding protein 1
MVNPPQVPIKVVIPDKLKMLSGLDHSGRFDVRLVHIGPDGMKVDPFFHIDLNHFETGPARGHGMLWN